MTQPAVLLRDGAVFFAPNPETVVVNPERTLLTRTLCGDREFPDTHETSNFLPSN
jgi:hypothetical protein